MSHRPIGGIVALLAITAVATSIMVVGNGTEIHPVRLVALGLLVVGVLGVRAARGARPIDVREVGQLMVAGVGVGALTAVASADLSRSLLLGAGFVLGGGAVMLLLPTEQPEG